jgi:nitrate reductase gamma subunit
VKQLVSALCSDECTGRAPGTPGGRLARRHVIDALRAAGLAVRRARISAEWWPYGACVIAAFGTGALMVALAPLRPWREPAAAGVLAIAVVATLALAGPSFAANSLLARALHPWYVGLGIAAVSVAMAAAGGLVVRRIVTATTRATLVVLLSALVTSGIILLTVLATSPSNPAFMGAVGMASIAAGGFLTQAVIAPERPWACGAGGGVFFVLASVDWNEGVSEIAGPILAGLIFILIGYGGARLAWRHLRSGAAPSSPDIPSARLG